MPCPVRFALPRAPRRDAAVARTFYAPPSAAPVVCQQLDVAIPATHGASRLSCPRERMELHAPASMLSVWCYGARLESNN